MSVAFGSVLVVTIPALVSVVEVFAYAAGVVLVVFVAVLAAA